MALNQGLDNTPKAKEHFWAVLENFKDLFMISNTTDGKQHGRPMHIAQATPSEGIYFFTSLHSAKVEEEHIHIKHII